MHWEVSVHYTFKKDDEGAENFQPFVYESNMKSSTKDRYVDSKWYKNTVYCRNRREFERLLEHWNRTPYWDYRELKDEYEI
jgi:hypothetical protein